MVYKVIDMRVKDVPPTAETSIARHLMMQSDRIVGALIIAYLPDSATKNVDPFLFMMIEHSLTAGIDPCVLAIHTHLTTRDWHSNVEGKSVAGHEEDGCRRITQ